jgi:hypothetical protein
MEPYGKGKIFINFLKAYQPKETEVITREKYDEFY